MYGIFDQKVAINNAVPSLADGRLDIDDTTWGWGANVGVLYEPTPGTRLGLTYTSAIDLDFRGPAQFSGIGPILTALLQSRGLFDARVDVGAKVPYLDQGEYAKAVLEFEQVLRFDNLFNERLSGFLFGLWEHNGYHEDIPVDDEFGEVRELTPDLDIYELGGGLTYEFTPGWSLRPEVLYIRDEGDTQYSDYSATEFWLIVCASF